MSGRIVAEVLDYAPEDLTIAQRFVLVALAESARDQGPTARVSRTNTTKIAQQTGIAPGTVRNALSELARRGLIRPQHEHSKVGRGRLAQDYRIHQLEAHHRAVAAPPKASPGGDAEHPNSVTPE